MALVARVGIVVVALGATACRPQATSAAELLEEQQQQLDDNAREALDNSGPASVEDYQARAPGSREATTTETSCRGRALTEGCTWEICLPGGGTRIEHESQGTRCGEHDDGKCDGKGECVRPPPRP